MSKIAFKNDLRQMFKWAISKAFENNPNEKTCPNELNDIIFDVWKEMTESGEIVLERNEQRNIHKKYDTLLH